MNITSQGSYGYQPLVAEWAPWLNKCLLLTEFSDRTVSYGSSFFPVDLWPKREAYSTDRENEVTLL